MSKVSKKVISIDPGDLRCEVLQLGNVLHIRSLCESQDAQTALSDLPSLCPELDRQDVYISACVCDINVDPIITAELLAKHVLPHMRARHDAFVIVTLKMMKNHKPKHLQQAVTNVIQILSNSSCKEFKVVHLNANSKDERTIVCRYYC